MSDKGKPYGSQYRTLFQSGDIKFVAKEERTSEALMETMTRGRVYVTVGGNDLLEIIYFDKNNKRNKVIGFDDHKGMKPHVHHGYLHNEWDSQKGASNLTPEEKKMVERVTRIWYDHLGRK